MDPSGTVNKTNSPEPQLQLPFVPDPEFLEAPFERWLRLADDLLRDLRKSGPSQGRA